MAEEATAMQEMAEQTGTTSTQQDQTAQSDPLTAFLKTPENQAAFDRRVQQALSTAKTKWDAERDSAIQNAVTEAQKLAKMTAEQRAQHEREQETKKLAKREAAYLLGNFSPRTPCGVRHEITRGCV